MNRAFRFCKVFLIGALITINANAEKIDCQKSFFVGSSVTIKLNKEIKNKTDKLPNNGYCLRVKGKINFKEFLTNELKYNIFKNQVNIQSIYLKDKATNQDEYCLLISKDRQQVDALLMQITSISTVKDFISQKGGKISLVYFPNIKHNYKTIKSVDDFYWSVDKGEDDEEN